MRLDKLTIGSAKESPTHQFKNLKNVTIDFDEEHWVTVVIGWNGTGKSNVLEALAIIFRDLIAKKRTPSFAFQLAYRMGSDEKLFHIHIDADPDRDKEPFVIHVATDFQARGEGTLTPFIEGEETVSALRGNAIKLTAFLKADSDYLPRYVFSYYSGESPRMHEIFRPYLESYDSKLRNGEDPGLKRLFYAMPVHSQFVLLAFLIQQSDIVRTFLDEHLGLDPDEGIESVLFVLRQPPWKSKATDGDPRFWNARGVVRDFLSRLYDIALAPIEVSRQVSTSIWNKTTLQFKYLYVKDIEALRRLVGDQAPAQFFRDLESTYVSELIEEVRIKVRLKKNDGSVTFRELSEGEQQLLTVLGLLRFTAEDESLFLLDEPDTHLNPRWSVDYLNYLKSFVGQNSTGDHNSHIVLTTHNPSAIAELAKGQVQILYREAGSRTIRAENPAVDPKGMGFAGIVTSDMFGLGSSLDKATNHDLLELHRLSTQKQSLSEADRANLLAIRKRLEGLDFNFASRDRLEQEYLRARFDLSTDNITEEAIITPENKQKALEALIHSLLSSLQEGKP
ncbi:AAA family ATPase [Pectobacterium aroidearum]|uniref:AAA family ATPase n=1 Tax=Pectobacterium aroidearum TaxID=1201031 RepID=UPI0021157BD8|nr:AAA family ATPase [Pectobacterium aroidearum]UUE34911.1 AAA family ATPase [Pectobacterium aroidearum]UUE39288.1 AAA family ATPase [Pectobacterium aroidearum]